MNKGISEQILYRIKELNPKIKELIEDKDNSDDRKICYFLIEDVKRIFKLFFRSVITGEYIGNSNIEEKMLECASLITEPIETFESTPFTNSKDKSFIELKDIIELVKNIIDTYILFIREISIIYQNDYEDYFIFRNSSFSRKDRPEINLFISFLNVSYFDIQLSDKKHYYSELEWIKRNIEEINREKIFPFLAEEIKKIIDFIKPLNITKVNILPYHNIGMHKYKKLYMQYEGENLKRPSDEKVEEIKQIFKLNNFETKIGG